MRNKIVPQLRQHLAQLGPALIKEHGKDLQHAPNSKTSSGATTPVPGATSSAGVPDRSQSSKSSTTTSHSSGHSSVNVTTVVDTSEYQTTAEELYRCFTDPQRIAAFTRAAPKLFEGAKKGAKFELFGGNVSGEYVELEEPSLIVQRWRLQQWPAGHYSRLQIKFDQNDQDAVTVMRVHWEGVPIGQEEVTKRNWGEYYVVCDECLFQPHPHLRGSFADFALSSSEASKRPSGRSLILSADHVSKC